MINETHSTSTLATRDYKLELQQLSLKKCGHNLKTLHINFDNTILKIKQSGADVDAQDQIMYLFQAYRTYDDNEQFQSHVSLLESQWSPATIMTPAELREKVDVQVQTMIQNKRWYISKKPA